MRSRPRLKVFLNPPVALPGRALVVEARLESGSETPVDSLELSLRGRESVWLGESHDERSVLSLVARFEPGTLVPGEHRYAARFDLPLDAPPSYEGRHGRVAYELDVHVEIPWWPDRKGSYVVPVGRLPSPAEVDPPVAFCSAQGGPQRGELYLECSLDRTGLEPGGTLTGAVALANTVLHRVRRVELAFVAEERAPGLSSTAMEVRRYQVTLHQGAPGEGVSLPFRVRLPPDAPPTFKSALFELAWHLELAARVAWGEDLKLLVPFRVLATPSRGGDAPDRWVAPVGRERRALVWARVAAQHGLAHDPERERLQHTVGAVSLTLGLEHRGDRGTWQVAALAWPPQGLGLELAERRWTSALLGEDVALDDARFQRRFSVRAREPAQAQALLDGVARATLLAFDEATVGDEGAQLATRGSGHEAEALGAFAAQALAAARALGAGLARVPAPDAMRAHEGAWRAFAERTGGRFSPGRMAVFGASLGLERVDVVTWWAGRDAPEATEVVMAIDPPLPAGMALASGDFLLSSRGAALLAEVEASVREVRIEHDAVRALVGAPLADPASLGTLLERLGRLCRALRGAAEKGPFR